ncbi:Mu transposase C-terminal domain-containing protein [Mesorhizobium sp. M0213]|uniref:Mu transposase C-terminal domain-containing protein n=1 Tax=Mesorhizobium sp. M0213 TaxID=2956917 RepID=UPI003337E18A
MRPDGIHLFKFRYWSPALSADVGRAGRRLLVKYDLRDLSRVFVRRPSGNFAEARYADVTLPSVTLREVTTARRTLLEKGRGEVSMRTIMRTVMAQRELVDAAVKKRRRSAAGRPVVRKSKVDEAGWARFAASTPANPYPLSRIRIELR